MIQASQSPDIHRSLKRLVACADELTPDLLFKLVSETCPPIPNERTLPIYNKLRRFARQGAWLDAAGCLIDLGLPRWRIQQIYCEDGRWTCVLCLRWFPAEWLNAVCIGEHAVFELAILAAYVDTVERACELEQALANIEPIRPIRSVSPIAIYSKAK